MLIAKWDKKSSTIIAVYPRNFSSVIILIRSRGQELNLRLADATEVVVPCVKSKLVWWGAVK